MSSFLSKYPDTGNVFLSVLYPHWKISTQLSHFPIFAPLLLQNGCIGPLCRHLPFPAQSLPESSPFLPPLSPPQPYKILSHFLIVRSTSILTENLLISCRLLTALSASLLQNNFLPPTKREIWVMPE